jgi:CheY-like chemotaxis protein
MSEKISILIVDDIFENLEILSNILTSEGYNITFAESGRSALNIISRKNFSLILLDVMMPDMSGFEVCEILKKDEKNSDIPIIFLTARTETEDIVKGFELGAVDYISKPFSAKELISRVNTHLYLKKAKDIIEQQKKELEIKNRNLTSSIQYAKIIQNAVLPSDDFLRHYMPDSFIINLPRDIVSGDFYWIRQIEDLIMIAAADCTGHGIPGAFMSMLGIAFLSEISLNADWKNGYKASDMLDELRIKVKLALHQDRRKDAVSDGMDIALCVIGLTNKQMQYAGANNPLYILRKKENDLFDIIIYRADKQPIATHIIENQFTNNEIQLFKEDKLYLFSDGYVDQFGGEDNQKFLRKNFINLLLGIADFDMKKQKKVLLDTFYNWKSDREQVDDLLVIGMKIENDYGEVDFL